MKKADENDESFSFPKELETIYVSAADGWDEVHITGDNTYYPLTFLISDDGQVVVEFAGDSSSRKSHVRLSDLKKIIGEVEAMAQETFD